MRAKPGLSHPALSLSLSPALSPLLFPVLPPFRVGKGLVQRLKALIPRHQFRVPLQAAIGGRVLASEAIPAVRKDVLAKCYGGDVSRKKKLLAKQAKGKKRMKSIGRVDVPQAAFMAVLSIGGGGGGGGADE